MKTRYIVTASNTAKTDLPDSYPFKNDLAMLIHLDKLIQDEEIDKIEIRKL